MEERVHSKGRLALEHVVDRPLQLVSQAGQGFTLRARDLCPAG